MPTILEKLKAMGVVNITLLDEEEPRKPMIQFNEFLIEKSKYLLAVDRKGKKTKGNPAGVLNELLIGCYLKGCKGDARAKSNRKYHMTKHPGEDGISPAESFDKLLLIFTDEQYKILANRAKRVADEMIDFYEKEGVEIKDVHWTSRPDQTELTTGIKATNKQDDSDIVVTLRKKGIAAPIFDGVSLKAYEKWKNTINASNSLLPKNPNIEIILQRYKDGLLALTKGKQGVNSEERAAFFADPKNAKIKEKAEILFQKMQSEARDDLIKQLERMTPKQLAAYVRKTIHSEQTPSQAHGHWHHRWEVFGLNDKCRILHSDPAVDMDDILYAMESHPELIDIKPSGRSGATISYDGHKIVQPTLKLQSKSDYFNAVVVIGLSFFQKDGLGEGWRKDLGHIDVVNPEQKAKKEPIATEPMEINNTTPGSDASWSSPDELPKQKSKKKETKEPVQAKRKIIIPNVKTTVSKQKIKAAVEQSFKGDGKQAPAPKAADNDIWAQIEKKYTTTHDSYEEISKVFGKSVEEIDSHRRNGNWHRPPRKIAV